MPASQDRPVSFIPDPQTWLQPQLWFHLEKALQPQRRSFPFLKKLIWSHLTAITITSVRNSSRLDSWTRHHSTTERTYLAGFIFLWMHLKIFFKDTCVSLFLWNVKDASRHAGCYSKNICFLYRPSPVTPATFACCNADWLPGVYLNSTITMLSQ